jgi:MYXO-CTERM domain-containing protein
VRPVTRSFPRRDLIMLPALLLAGPLAWSLDMASSQFLLRTASATGRVWPHIMINAATFALAVLGALGAWRRYREGARDSSDGDEGMHDLNRPGEAVRVLALWALALSALSALLIAAQAVAPLVFAPGNLA